MTIPQTVPGPARFYHPELDVLRFVAFALVFLHHAIPRFPDEYLKHGLSSSEATLAASVVNAAGFGLSLFFFLSAFLITTLLCLENHRNGSVAIRDFYIRRALRIWPLYFACLIIGAGVTLYDEKYGPVPEQGAWIMIGMYALMIGNWFFAAGSHSVWPANPMTPLWSISVEEQFYLFWPWLVNRVGTAGIAGASAIMLIIAVFAEGWLGAGHADQDFVIWTNSFVCFEFFAVGALTALALKNRTMTLRAPLRWLAVVGAAALWLAASVLLRIKSSGPAPDGATIILGYAMVAAGCVMLLLAIWGWPAWHRWPIRLGRISYGLYCFHMLAFAGVDYAVTTMGHGVRGTLGRAICALVLTVAMAELSYRYFETPFLRLKDRFSVVASRPV